MNIKLKLRIPNANTRLWSLDLNFSEQGHRTIDYNPIKGTGM